MADANDCLEIEIYGLGGKWLAYSRVKRVPGVGERIAIMSQVAPFDIRPTGVYRVTDVLTSCFDRSAGQPSSGIQLTVEKLEE